MCMCTLSQPSLRSATRLSCVSKFGNRVTSIQKANRRSDWIGVSARRRYAVDHPEISSADRISQRCFGADGSHFRKDRRTSTRGTRGLAQRIYRHYRSDDARDFDDAIHVEKIDNGGWRLGVHIADVAAYVEPESALDREARRRGNSVYLPDRVIPMLPERLSNGVCSLNPGVDRLTHSVFIHFDKNGVAKGARFARSVIRSAHRLNYKQAYAILKSPPCDRLSERLHLPGNSPGCCGKRDSNTARSTLIFRK